MRPGELEFSTLTPPRVEYVEHRFEGVRLSLLVAANGCFL
jgi:hypothetical protein